MLLVNFIHALFHSTIVTLPLSDSAISDSLSAIFLELSCSSDQSSHCEVSSTSPLRPSNRKVAPAFLLAFATPMIDAAVTPEPPPLTSHTSSD